MKAIVASIVIGIVSLCGYAQVLKVDFIPALDSSKPLITPRKRIELPTIRDRYEYRLLMNWIFPIAGALPMRDTVEVRTALNKRQKITYRISK